MINEIYVTYDIKAEAYSTPMFEQNKATMLRNFTTVVNQKNNQINAHPEDFILYKIGEYCYNTGHIKSIEPPLHMGKAIDYLKKPEIPSAIVNDKK